MNVEAFLTYISTRGTDFAINLVTAAAIFFIGRMVARMLSRAATSLVEQKAQDPTLSRFVGSLTYATLLVIVVLAAISRLGVQTTSFIAILGAAGLAVGMALQGSLANFASGVLMLVFRPISVGEYVEVGGTEGSVREVGIFTTSLLTPDNKLIILGNAQVTGGLIVNYSREETRRIDLVIGISYDDDIQKARETILAAIAECDKLLTEPAPIIGLLELGDNSVNLAVRPWVKTVDYWPARFQLMESIKNRCDADGISFPYPQRDVHMHTVEAA